MKKLEGKIALVTGAALGYKDGGPSIGSAIVFRLADQGARVVVVDINDEMGQRTADKINVAGGEAVFIKVDTANTAEVQAAIAKTQEKFGGLHCLVNCAASYDGDIFNGVVDTPEQDWLQIFDVNLHGYYRFAKYAVPLMQKSGGGTIINISSVAAFAVVPNFAVYPVTKAAINALTRVLAVDYAPEIRTNAVCPGFVQIANSEGGRTPEQLQEWWGSIAKGYPLKRVCTVEEIASAVLFLASDDSSYINGECLKVDGGRAVADVHEF